MQTGSAVYDLAPSEDPGAMQSTENVEHESALQLHCKREGLKEAMTACDTSFPLP